MLVVLTQQIPLQQKLLQGFVQPTYFYGKFPWIKQYDQADVTAMGGEDEAVGKK